MLKLGLRSGVIVFEVHREAVLQQTEVKADPQLGLIQELLSYSLAEQPPVPPHRERELRQKAGGRRVGRRCAFCCRVWRKRRASFLFAAATEVRDVRSLCGVGHDEQRGFLRGQIRGSAAQRGRAQQTETANEFIERGRV